MYVELKLYLKRHQLINNLEEDRMKKDLLKSKINEKEKKGYNVTSLRDFYKQLCVVFCEYYDLFFEES